MHSALFKCLVAAFFAVSAQMSCCWQTSGLAAAFPSCMESSASDPKGDDSDCCPCCRAEKVKSPAETEHRHCPGCESTFFKDGVFQHKATLKSGAEFSFIAFVQPEQPLRLVQHECPAAPLKQGVPDSPVQTLLRLHCALTV